MRPSHGIPSRFLLSIALILIVAAAAEAAPIAMVTDITGTGAKRLRQDRAAELVVGMELEAGDVLEAPGGACSLSLLYPDGGMLEREIRAGERFPVPLEAEIAAPGLLSRLRAGIGGLFSDRSDSRSQETGSMNIGMVLARLPARPAGSGDPAPTDEGGETEVSEDPEIQAGSQAVPQETEAYNGPPPLKTRAVVGKDDGRSPFSRSPVHPVLQDPKKNGTGATEIQAMPSTPGGTREPKQEPRAEPAVADAGCMLARFEVESAGGGAAAVADADLLRTYAADGGGSEAPWTEQVALEPGRDYRLFVTDVKASSRHTLRMRLPDDEELRNELDQLSRELDGKDTGELFALGNSLMNEGYLLLARRCFALVLARFHERKLSEDSLASVRRPLEGIEMVVGPASGGARD